MTLRIDLSAAHFVEFWFQAIAGLIFGFFKTPLVSFLRDLHKTFWGTINKCENKNLTLPVLGGRGGWGGGASRPAVSNMLIWLFIDLSNWPKIPWLFLKFSAKNFFLVISVNYCWRHYFLTKVILVKSKILYILMQWSTCFIFWNIFLYYFFFFVFLELSSATCFLCIWQTQLTRRNTSIPKKT